MALGWKTRVGIVISAIWLILAYVIGDSGDRLSTFLLLGALPLLLVWGLVWAIAGWRAQRPARPAEEVAAARGTNRKRTLSGIGSFVIVGLGLLAASMQLSSAGSGGSVAYYFGQWVVGGLVAAVLLSALSSRYPGIVSVGAALVVAIGVNWSAHSQVSEERAIRESLARATPLFAKMQTEQVQDQEVMQARVGLFEPALLAQAAFSRELWQNTLAYQKDLESLDLESIFTPARLATDDGRQQSRLVIGRWTAATNEFNTAQTAALARAKARMQAAAEQMPESHRSPFLDGFARGSGRMETYLRDFYAVQLEGVKASTELIDLLDNNQGQFELFKGPPPNLLFRTDALLQEYRQRFKRVTDVANKEQSVRNQFQAAQSGVMIELGDLVSSRK